MTRTTTLDRLPRELAYRVSDGIEVWLLWMRSDNSLRVLVVDGRINDSFEFPVTSDVAIDAFNHPFAYAAHRGVAYASRKRTGDVVYA